MLDFSVDWGSFPRMRLFQPHAHHMLSSLYLKPFFTKALFFIYLIFFNFGLDLMAENVFLFPRAQNTVLGPDRHEANLQ